MITVESVIRSSEGAATEVVVSNGLIKICYILMDGKLFEKGRWANQRELSMSPTDYRKAIKKAAGILKEERKKAIQR